jgi:hypothetical protein
MHRHTGDNLGDKPTVSILAELHCKVALNHTGTVFPRQPSDGVASIQQLGSPLRIL